MCSPMFQRPASPSPFWNGGGAVVGAGSLMGEIASDAVLDAAYEWLCRRRREAPSCHDVWHLRWSWPEEKPRLQAELLGGSFRLGPSRRILTEAGAMEFWSSRDAVVVKAVALVFSRRFAGALGSGCFNAVGRGGVKGAVRAVAEAVPDYEFVYRSDVRKYYASLEPEVVFSLVERVVRDPLVLDWIWRYLHRAIYVDGGYVASRGLPRGCPLSPVLGAMCLRDVDASVEGLGVVFVRFMDDWVVLARSRWVLRRAVRRIREVVARLRLELAPDKTFVGRVSRGFDFCGYFFDGVRVGVSRAAISRFVERVHRLYEQGASDGRVGEYVGHWVRWVGSGLGGGASHGKVVAKGLRRSR